MFGAHNRNFSAAALPLSIFCCLHCDAFARSLARIKELNACTSILLSECLRCLFSCVKLKLTSFFNYENAARKLSVNHPWMQQQQQHLSL
jgi:hypothetical protein